MVDEDKEENEEIELPEEGGFLEFTRFDSESGHQENQLLVTRWFVMERMRMIG